MVLRGLVAVGLAWTVVACASEPPPSTPPDAETVVASWAADDGSVVVLNVVVGPRADRGRLPALARRLRDAYPDARVIVTVFADSAGPERYEIGHVPSADDPLSTGARPTSALVTFDFPRPTSAPTDGER